MARNQHLLSPVEGGAIHLLSNDRTRSKEGEFTMDHFYYEMMGKEKLKDLREEGMRNQALHTSGAQTPGLRNAMSRFILALVGILGMLVWLVR